MAERRRALRYLLSAPIAAELAPLQDVLVERVDEDHLVATCPDAARPLERLALQFVAPAGDAVSIDVRVVASEPVLAGGRISFRVRLRAEPPRPLGHAIKRPEPPVPAVLVRRHSVEIRNISGIGCLLDAYIPFAAGTIALLETTLGDRRCVEAARIARADAGARGTFLIGAEFLPLSPAGASSMRAAIATLDARSAPRG